MAKIVLMWLIFIAIGLLCSHGEIRIEAPREYHGICTSIFVNRMANIKKLQNCTVVVGDLIITLLERTKPKDFRDISFPKLKEVTGFMVVYRVSGLESLGDLFPNLARIRGNTLLYNYALIVYDMPRLREIGFYNLLKIDRGGVIIWGGKLTCFIDSIDWNVIAPKSRHVLSIPDKGTRCMFVCTCTRNAVSNRCWNNKKCQRFLEGPDAEDCDVNCFGCRKTNPKSCTLCRNYTINNTCVNRCPNNTIILTESNYCVTIDECKHLNRFEFNNTCVEKCPNNYEMVTIGRDTSCKPCVNCDKTCKSLIIQTLASIQATEKCVYVNGSLTIHVRSVPGAMDELRYYLKNIKEVSGYILIYGSISVTSLDFLSSLKSIKGNTLLNGKYSLVVYDMQNLQMLFSDNVTKKLKINKGSMRFYRNPILCMSQIEKLKPLFPVAPNEIDLPQGLNGYSGGCKEINLGLKINVKNQTFAVATFDGEAGTDVFYTILYIEISHDTKVPIGPEACSESEWNAISVSYSSNRLIEVPLHSLRPASMYAVCIEKYEPSTRHLARSAIVNFTTPPGKPEPPFITELVASSSDVVVVRWVDHKNYERHITRYELDVYLIEKNQNHINTRDYCQNYNDIDEIDYSRHAKVMRPPRDYGKGCESMCGILSSFTFGAMVDEYFDICNSIKGCEKEVDRPKVDYIKGLLKTVSLDITAPRKVYQIGGLAPFRDYRFHLRACIKDLCSRSAREVVRTLRLENIDIASITFTSAEENGLIVVNWDPPAISNGVILSYTVEICPDNNLNDMSHLLPQVMCVFGNETSLTVKSHKANIYLIRVCTTTLAYSYVCNNWTKVMVIQQNYLSIWIGGVVFGILLCVISIKFGWHWKQTTIKSDDIPLVDATSANRNESEPPAIMLSDFMPLYSIDFGHSE
ncbi:insulin-like growth factor 1 receptor isoform X1 [Danaus plexippus]|uniref:insulin-like growth factor 1 receptor isoform X1 n=1 Tax=Danaus plexippus TaxID=13037 RepID=UPI002AB0C418|nr:insulin-like growth factor 1 receptor isoform X1 [Danaus plexippus]